MTERPFTVYLGGTINRLSYIEASKRRVEITRKLAKFGIQTRDPMRWYVDAGFDDSDIMTIEAVEKTGHTFPEIKERDLHDLRMSDVILVLTGDDLSWGTSGEFWFMVWVEEKPSVIVYENKERPISPWASHFATRVVGSDEEAAAVLAKWAQHRNPEEQGSNWKFGITRTFYHPPDEPELGDWSYCSAPWR